ncbi:hypothetical protein [uncultured Maricaulis sp.]|uniref:hypothetical protein n=1 Tax=uncultured Maricaulis sp. TaxID=174710 RepID=UPI0030D9A1CE|tara:strand:- start:44317 stop:45015 length:699 start_codon:yes stop_codon:yes gene_type:complete
MTGLMIAMALLLQPADPAVAASAAALPMIERTERLEVERFRRDRHNQWRAGEWTGQWSGMGSYSSGFGRQRNYSRASFSVTGPGFETGMVTAECEGGQLDWDFLWIEWAHEDLAYVCTFSRDGALIEGARFELALQRSRGFAGMGRNERAGQITYGGQTLRLRTQRLSGTAFPSGRVPGYVILDGEQEIGGMDYGVFKSKIYLPPEGVELRAITLLAALSVVHFMDPANSNH